MTTFGISSFVTTSTDTGQSDMGNLAGKPVFRMVFGMTPVDGFHHWQQADAELKAALAPAVTQILEKGWHTDGPGASLIGVSVPLTTELETNAEARTALAREIATLLAASEQVTQQGTLEVQSPH